MKVVLRTTSPEEFFELLWRSIKNIGVANSHYVSWQLALDSNPKWGLEVYNKKIRGKKEFLKGGAEKRHRRIFKEAVKKILAGETVEIKTFQSWHSDKSECLLTFRKDGEGYRVFFSGRRHSLLFGDNNSMGGDYFLSRGRRELDRKWEVLYMASQESDRRWNDLLPEYGRQDPYEEVPYYSFPERAAAA